MQSFWRRPSTSVQIKRGQSFIPRISTNLLMFFIGIEYEIKVTMSIENSSAYKMMSRFARKLLNSSNHLIIDRETTKLIQQFIIVDFLIGSIWNHIRINVWVIINLLFLNHQLCWCFVLFCLGLFGLYFHLFAGFLLLGLVIHLWIYYLIYIYRTIFIPFIFFYIVQSNKFWPVEIAY